MVRRGWLIVGEPLLAIRRFSTGGPTETYRRRPMTLVGHWWADSDKPTATCRPLPPLAHQSNAIWAVFNSELAFFARASSTSELFDGTQRSISFTSVTVLGSVLLLFVRAPSNSVMIGCAQCSLFPTNMTLFEFSLVLCLRAPTNSVEMGCALCSSGILASVDISLVTDSSKSW